MATKKAKVKAEYRTQDWPGVKKAIALRVLLGGALDVLGFGRALVALGFKIKGPRKPFNILARLLAQGLVRREITKEEVTYQMKVGGESKPVSRGCTRVRWSLTKKGQERLKYLDREGPGRI
jgi:hypothetical protein